MEELISDFITHLKHTKNASENTLTAYRRDLQYFKNFIGNNDIRYATKTTIMSYILFLHNEKQSTATISRKTSSLKRFFTYLKSEKIIDENPANYIELPKVSHKVPYVLTLSQIEKFLSLPNTSTQKGLRDMAMLEILYATGMRVSEIIDLKTEDINLSLEYVRCGGKKERIIPLYKKALEALIDYLKFGRPKLVVDDTNILFLNLDGQPLTRQGFWKIVRTYGKKAFETLDITPNTIRHSFATHLVSNGCDLHSIQEMMGYADISSTQIYTKLSSKRLKEEYVKSHPRA